MKRYFFGKRLLMILLFVFAVITPLGFIVMALWNNILVPVLHVAVINFWQALGIFTLSRLLFGGIPGGWGRGRGGHWNREWNGGGFEKRKEMMEKWQTMTPEERIKFKQEWKNRCRSGRWGGDFRKENFTAAEPREKAPE